MTESDNYTPEYRAADARIALAMGWKITGHDVDGNPVGVDPAFKPMRPGFPRELSNPEIPYYHRDCDASRALLEWLAADMGRWPRFIDKLTAHVNFSDPHLDHYELLRTMLAKPAQIAQAVDAMLTDQSQSNKQK